MKDLHKQVLEELAAIAFSNCADHLQVVDGNLVLRQTDQLKKKQQAAVASMEKTSSGIRVKLYDKLKALELLGKYLGLFDGKTPVREQDNGLLEALLHATEKEVGTHEIPELQQTAADRPELVESAEAERI